MSSNFASLKGPSRSKAGSTAVGFDGVGFDGRWGRRQVGSTAAGFDSSRVRQDGFDGSQVRRQSGSTGSGSTAVGFVRSGSTWPGTRPPIPAIRHIT
jgi:hypothetical protein